MSDRTKSWDQVGKQVEVVKAQLRRRLDEANEDLVADRQAADKVVRALFSALDDSLEAVTSIVRDPVLRAGLKDLVLAVREAVEATFEDARDQLAATSGKRPHAAKAVARKASAHTTPAAHRPATRRTGAPRRAASATKVTGKQH